MRCPLFSFLSGLFGLDDTLAPSDPVSLGSFLKGLGEDFSFLSGTAAAYFDMKNNLQNGYYQSAGGSLNTMLNRAIGDLILPFALYNGVRGVMRARNSLQKASFSAEGISKKAVSEANESIKLSNINITYPTKNKLFVNSTEGYINASVDSGELTVDMYRVFEKFQGNDLGTSLIQKAIKSSPQKVDGLRAFMDYANKNALKETGDIWKTPFGKSAKKLGFNKSELDGDYYLFYR